MSKCADGVARTFNVIESRYADKLEENSDVKEFRCQVLLEELEMGEYCSDFVAIKVDGDLMVRECVFRKHSTKPMTAKLLDASRMWQTVTDIYHSRHNWSSCTKSYRDSERSVMPFGD